MKSLEKNYVILNFIHNFTKIVSVTCNFNTFSKRHNYEFPLNKKADFSRIEQVHRVVTTYK